MPAAVAATGQSHSDHPLVWMETATSGSGHAVSLQETPSETFTTSATVILEVVREYFDLGSSKAQLLQMMADATVDDPSFRKVLVSDFSRVSRRIEELNGYLERLAAHGVELISVTVSEAGVPVSGIGNTSPASTPNRSVAA